MKIRLSRWSAMVKRYALVTAVPVLWFPTFTPAQTPAVTGRAAEPSVRLGALAMQATPTSRPAVTAFVDVAVVPMDRERVLAHQTVLVRGDRIVALGPAQKVAVPAGARRVDGRGRYLIPGLADMHAHLGLSERVGMLGAPLRSFLDLAQDRSLSSVDRLTLKEQQLFLWLAHGLTTARVLDHVVAALGADLRGTELLALRARAARGEILSPRLNVAGYIKGTAEFPDTVTVESQRLRLDEVVEAVASYKAAGFDFIKVHAVTIEDDSVFEALAAAARQAGLPLVGHTVVPLARALATYRSIEHGTGYVGYGGYEPVLNEQMPADSLALRMRQLAEATARAGVWNCPTLYNTFRNYDQLLPVRRRMVKALQDAGAGLLAGSDRLQSPRWVGLDSATRVTTLRALTPAEQRLERLYGYAGATHQELAALVSAGLTPYQALATATRNVAAYFGTLDSAGTIAVGKRADLVLLDGNPFIDIRQTERIAGVMIGGRWLDRTALDRRTTAISVWATRWCASSAGARRTGCSLP